MKGSICVISIFIFLSNFVFIVQFDKEQLDSTTADSFFDQASGSFSLPSIDWSHYHNYTEIVTFLMALNNTYPNIVDLFSIGKSWENHDIYCIRLTNESNIKPKPEVLFVGYHHAQEQITSELPLYFIVYVATNFGINDTLTEFLNGCEVYVIVALNVDGFDLFEINDWQRKNARPTDEDSDGIDDEDPPEDVDEDGFIEALMNYTYPWSPEFIKLEGEDNDNDGINGEDWIGGVDLNRNYAIAWENGVSDPWSQVYRGPTPFSEPETMAIKDLVLVHNFKYAISFHSGLEFILYPWGSTYDPAPDATKFLEISEEISNITGGTPYVMPDQMGQSYGLWMDWMYDTKGVLALTCEIFRNETWNNAIIDPGPYPSTMWEGGDRWLFNPFPNNIESIVSRWLPVFLSIINRTINETFHDVCVEKIELNRTIVGKGSMAELNISIQNEGYFQETFNVSIHANTTILHTQEITLPGENTEVIIFVWNTTDFIEGNYTIIVEATSVPEENNFDDNILSAKQEICVTIPGDVDADFDVDIFDIVAIASAYGTTSDTPDYKANYDLVYDDKIDIFDIVLAASNYGKSLP